MKKNFFLSLLPCVLLVTGCATTSSRVDLEPNITLPTTAPHETDIIKTFTWAKGFLVDSLQNARQNNQTPSDIQVTEAGFQFFDGNRTRAYRFSELGSLIVGATINFPGSPPQSFINLDTADDHITPASLVWMDASKGDEFITSIKVIKMIEKIRNKAKEQLADLGFAEFQQKAKAWRELPEKPPLPESVQRFRAQAEDALQNKDFEQAVDYYEQGLAVEPMWAAGHFNAALLCGELQEYPKAILHMKRYLELQPDAKDAKAGRDKMYVWEGKIK